MQVWRTMWPQGGVAAWEALWRALRGVYVGEVAETRAARWWSRRDRETARESLRLIEALARSQALSPAAAFALAWHPDYTVMIRTDWRPR